MHRAGQEVLLVSAGIGQRSLVPNLVDGTNDRHQSAANLAKSLDSGNNNQSISDLLDSLLVAGHLIKHRLKIMKC